ncbi:MAG: metal ABC transporter permease [Polaromonas sp.]|uniref:metal ABC transporter permease n=1 Tax=Polaromonas sp. TaxID=1869339 RepID=UPI00179B392F|nr:metal ABC transporter permease [Polaromonas sp.]NMM11142.1 metal ABC transporter permease [Polaromonas sp.]
METLYQWGIAPFAEFLFLRRALVAAVALAVSSAPLGVWLTLRRMSLFGDALSHAVLPGVAIGFMLFGLSLWAMALGGLIAGLVVVALASLISRTTSLKEDASLAAIYLSALALGVILISRRGTQLDLLHILFGSVLGVDADGLLLVAGMATVSVTAMALMYRGLLLESFDPLFMSSSGKLRGSSGAAVQQFFLMLVVINLVAGFQTMGTLMAVGMMMLPAVSARLWHDTLPAQLLNSAGQAALAAYIGLVFSFQLDTPSGPSIIAAATVLYFLSLVFSPRGWLQRGVRKKHFTR